jgi:Flp pilus assembly protein TadD
MTLAPEASNTGQRAASALSASTASAGDPNTAEALHRSGLAALDKEDIGGAVAALRAAAAADPSSPRYPFDLGVVLARAGHTAEALVAYDAAIDRQPLYWRAHFNAGLIRKAAGDLIRAEAHFTAVTAIDRGNAAAYISLASVVAAAGRRDEARDCLERAIEVDPSYYQAWNNLGDAIRDAGRPDAAIPYYDKAISLRPDDPEPHINRAMALLLAGRLREGWPAYRWRHRRAGQGRAFDRPQWNGAPLGGRTILIHAEQGLGDSIQFARYLPMVAARGGRVLLECPAPLVPLLDGQVAAERVIAKGAPLPDFDVHAPLLDLPGLFAIDVSTIPAPEPYLRPPAGRAVPLRQQPGRRQVGLAWGGNPRHWNDAARSCRLADLAPLFDLSGVAFYSLQNGERTRELCGHAGRLVDLCSRDRDLADAAAAVAGLDLVIAVDSALAHLAATMGKPVWLMLAHAPDWRWLLHREDTPWYPTMRLFRQPRPDDWASVVVRLRSALARDTGASDHSLV